MDKKTPDDAPRSILNDEEFAAKLQATPRHSIGDAGVYLRWQHNWQVREAVSALVNRFAPARCVIFLPR